MFTRSNGNDLWSLLLEKAYAKAHGGYKTLAQGLPHQAVMDLTGCPTVSYYIKDEKVQQMINQGKLWELMKYYNEEGYVVTGSTQTEEEINLNGYKNQNVKGLNPGYAYTVVVAKEVKGNKLLKIRNPWGPVEWEGDWSQNSPLWT